MTVDDYQDVDVQDDDQDPDQPVHEADLLSDDDPGDDDLDEEASYAQNA